MPHNHKEISAWCLHKDTAKMSICTQPDKASVNKERRCGRSSTHETLGIIRGGGRALVPPTRLTHPPRPPPLQITSYKHSVTLTLRIRCSPSIIHPSIQHRVSDVLDYIHGYSNGYAPESSCCAHLTPHTCASVLTVLLCVMRVFSTNISWLDNVVPSPFGCGAEAVSSSIGNPVVCQRQGYAVHWCC